ncbi:hypothetical protein ERO13_A06G195732v2 [Gossypium hirsutum]|uniref:Uncharacterized protein n=1 Tax=Gossypium hirsutum TaxID=3635 RepID=A0ABM3BYZ4_GOSHI|nr:uncharacterized protein LOC121230855 [Gossypium hirsutum]KAG4196825.1 hypothetical protein ERO13_A06G195732v2 [Gossypium hirsutum]
MHPSSRRHQTTSPPPWTVVGEVLNGPFSPCSWQKQIKEDALVLLPNRRTRQSRDQTLKGFEALGAGETPLATVERRTTQVCQRHVRPVVGALSGGGARGRKGMRRLRLKEARVAEKS